MLDRTSMILSLAFRTFLAPFQGEERCFAPEGRMDAKRVQYSHLTAFKFWSVRPISWALARIVVIYREKFILGGTKGQLFPRCSSGGFMEKP